MMSEHHPLGVGLDSLVHLLLVLLEAPLVPLHVRIRIGTGGERATNDERAGDRPTGSEAEHGWNPRREGGTREADDLRVGREAREETREKAIRCSFPTAWQM